MEDPGLWQAQKAAKGASSTCRTVISLAMAYMETPDPIMVIRAKLRAFRPWFFINRRPEYLVADEAFEPYRRAS